MRIAFFALIATLLLSGNVTAADRTVVCGTGDSQELLRRLAEAFQRIEPGTSVEVPDSIGSTGGIKAVAAGECELGRIARPLQENEQGLGLSYRLLALSPVVLVADPAVKVTNLTSAQVVDIFAGRIARWGKVGGIDAAISVVNREAKDSSRNELNAHLAGFKEVTAPVGVVAEKTPEALGLLLKNGHAIGYLPQAMVSGKRLQVLSLDGVAPTAANVQQGRYQIASPFAFVWKGQPRPGELKFMEFVKGAAGQKIILDLGLVPPALL